MSSPLDVAPSYHWTEYPAENVAGHADGSLLGLFGFDPLAGGPQVLRVDFLSVALTFGITDLASQATVYLQLGSSGIPIPLINTAVGNVTTNNLPAACTQLTRPLVIMDLAYFTLRGDSAVGSTSVIAATIGYSLAFRFG